MILMSWCLAFIGSCCQYRRPLSEHAKSQSTCVDWYLKERLLGGPRHNEQAGSRRRLGSQLALKGAFRPPSEVRRAPQLESFVRTPAVGQRAEAVAT